MTRNIDEIIRNLLKFSRCGLAERRNLNKRAIVLKVFDCWDIIPVARNQNDDFKVIHELDRIDREPHIPVALFRSARKYLQVLGFYFKSLVFERLEKVVVD